MHHPPTDSVRDDLAFMRGLVDSGAGAQWRIGALYCAGGLIYGAQVLYHGAESLGWIRIGGWPELGIVAGFTIAFLIVLVLILRGDRDAPRGGPSRRVLAAAYQGIGLANLAMIAVFGLNAVHGGLGLWLLYPAVVFALQGAAWYAASAASRHAWMCWVGIAMMGEAVALGLLVGNRAYIPVAAFGLIGLMALPGWVLMRQSRAAG